MPFKICKRCKQKLPATTEYFYKHKNTKDGLQSYCKTCSKEKAKEYENNHKEKVKIYRKRTREKHKQRIKQRTKQYREKNKEKIKKKQKELRDRWKTYWQTHNPYNPNETKTCTKCGKTYPKTEEYWRIQKNLARGLRYKCNKCLRNIEKQYIKKNKTKFKKSAKRHRLKRRYGITMEEYNLMFEEQQGKCAICGVQRTELNKEFCVDHDHKNDKIRELLCNNCNSGLGFFDDDIKLLKKAIKYLEKYKN